MSVHELRGCRIELPGGWEVVPSPDEQRLVAVEPAAPDGQPFRANLVLTAVDNGGLSFRDWQAGTDEMLPRQLTMYQVLDLERLPGAGHDGGRRLAEHVVDGTTPVTMEQWFALVDPIGYTLTATVDSWRYDEYADFFTEVARTLVVPRDDEPAQEGVQHDA